MSSNAPSSPFAPVPEGGSAISKTSTDLAPESVGLVDARVLNPQVPKDVREAILTSLYAERAELTRARRLGTITDANADYLADLNRYIDQWETAEPAPAQNVWGDLEKLAASLLSLQTNIELRRK
jgi:hypothetical protein